TSCTLKAIACKTSMDNSSVTSGDYNIVDLPGDVNGDCVVNILDLIAIRNRQGQDPAIGENGKYDINGDGRINILDLILVRNRLNTQCPQ
ncbi:MAG TPA: dockerin type I domain-containing protein, partial [Planctomycetota bacterium]|nr:dockerin type I domain-containing protein [Planctomycetota bacterium]